MNNKNLPDPFRYRSPGLHLPGKKFSTVKQKSNFKQENKEKIADSILDILNISESDLESKDVHLSIIRSLKIKLCGI